MDPIVWVIVALVVVAVAVWIASRRRTTILRERSGPGYERTAAEADARRHVESEPIARRERVEVLAIRPLDHAARQRFVSEWTGVQALFVDDPPTSLTRADALAQQVMRERGYPIDAFDQRAADISVDHPGVVGHYRVAHDVTGRAASDRSDTEEMRRGLMHYRELFAELLDDRESRTV
jgi:hypothetical protein